MEKAIEVMKRLIDNLSNAQKGDKTMEAKRTGKQKSYVCYVYGQIYAQYLVSDKSEFFQVENTMVQTWKPILEWLVRDGYIEEYTLGDTPETYNKVIIKGFNDNKLIYKKYIEAVENNIRKEAKSA